MTESYELTPEEIKKAWNLKDKYIPDAVKVAAAAQQKMIDMGYKSPAEIEVIQHTQFLNERAAFKASLLSDESVERAATFLRTHDPEPMEDDYYNKEAYTFISTLLEVKDGIS